MEREFGHESNGNDDKSLSFVSQENEKKTTSELTDVMNSEEEMEEENDIDDKFILLKKQK